MDAHECFKQAQKEVAERLGYDDFSDLLVKILMDKEKRVTIPGAYNEANRKCAIFIGQELDSRFTLAQVTHLMNDLLNTALIKPATSNNHIRIKKYPCSNSIADFVDEFMNGCKDS